MKATTLRLETYAARETFAALEETAKHAKKEAGKYARNVALAVAAPFIGLAFVVALPVAGLAALAWIGAKAFAAAYPGAVRALRNTALFVAAPFIGLAYAAAFPFVGIGLLAWVGARAVLKR